jgi:hypothetical protein
MPVYSKIFEIEKCRYENNYLEKIPTMKEVLKLWEQLVLLTLME